MKYLKEFATEAEYEAYVAGTSFVRPNASFVQETATVHYTDILKPGVYIMHTDGGVYTKDQWIERGFAKSEGFGIVVNDAKAKFIIRKTNSRQIAWTYSLVALDNILTTTDITQAVSDLNGFENTQIMYAAAQNAAASLTMTATSPLGGSAFIGSAGEWNIALQYRKDINDIISNCIDGDLLGHFNCWTSTQFNAESAWVFSQDYSYNNYMSAAQKNSTYVYVRLFYKF